MSQDPNITQYGTIRARSVEEIQAVCERHLRNIFTIHADLVDNDDGTPTDLFYIDMFAKAWQEMHEDVTQIIQNEQRSNV